MNKALGWVAEFVAFYVLWQVFDIITHFAESATGSSPFQTGFIPQLDIFSAITLGLAAFLVFVPFIPHGGLSKKDVEWIQRELGGEPIPESLKEWPRIYQFLTDPNFPRVYHFRSQYLNAIRHMEGFVLLEQFEGAPLGPTGNKLRSQIWDDIWNIAGPILKNRRQYRLSLGERLSESLTGSP